MMRNFVETALFTTRGFSFQVPGEALGFSNEVVYEVVVDYIQGNIKAGYLDANVWVREYGGNISRFVMQIYIAVEETDSDCEARMFNALADNENFREQLPVAAAKLRATKDV